MNLPLVFAIVAGIAAKVNSFPSSDLAFPEEVNGVKEPLQAHDRFRPSMDTDQTRYRPDHHHGYRPDHHWNHERPRRPDYYRPPGPRPGNNYIPTGSGPTQDSRPPFSRPGEDFRPQGSRPNEDSRPEDSQGSGPYSRPSFPRPGEDFRPQGSRPFGNPIPQRPNQEFTPSFSRPEGGFRPPSSRPSGGFDTQDSDGLTTSAENTRPQFPRPGENSQNYEPLGSRPGEYGKPQRTRPGGFSRPDGTILETLSGFQPDFINVGSTGASESPSENSDPSGSASLRPEQNSNTQDSQDGGIEGTTTPGTTETTTKIPRRDPTNRIVYTVTCPCTHTFQYKPVCGTDGQTYGNIGVLQCAKTCGSDVTVYLEGSCGRNNGHAGAISLKY